MRDRAGNFHVIVSETPGAPSLPPPLSRSINIFTFPQRQQVLEWQEESRSLVARTQGGTNKKQPLLVFFSSCPSLID